MKAFLLQAAEKAFPLRSQSFELLDGGDWFLEEKVHIGSHVIEANGSSEAWYVPPLGPHSLRPCRKDFLISL